MKESSFKIDKTLLIDVFKKLNIKRLKKKEEIRICEITIVRGKVKFNLAGAEFSLAIETSGTAKATFNIVDLIKILKTFDKKTLLIKVIEQRFCIDTFTIPAETTFFETDNVLRSVILPINYTDKDLLSIYLSGHYTVDELKFNRLWIVATQAENRFNRNINQAQKILSLYGVTLEEVKKLSLNKILQHEKY